MKTSSKLLIVVAAAATVGATNSAFAWCNDSYQPSSYIEQSDNSYTAYDNSSDDDYRASYRWDRHGFRDGHTRFVFAGHDRRR